MLYMRRKKGNIPRGMERTVTTKARNLRNQIIRKEGNECVRNEVWREREREIEREKETERGDVEDKRPDSQITSATSQRYIRAQRNGGMRATDCREAGRRARSG